MSQEIPPPHPALLPTIRLPAIVAFASLTIHSPPPCAHGRRPPTALFLMVLRSIVGAPAPNSEMPPPCAAVRRLPAIVLPRTTAVEAPWMRMPPPVPPLQPSWRLFAIVLFSTS